MAWKERFAPRGSPELICAEGNLAAVAQELVGTRGRVAGREASDPHQPQDCKQGQRRDRREVRDVRKLKPQCDAECHKHSQHQEFDRHRSTDTLRLAHLGFLVSQKLIHRSWMDQGIATTRLLCLTTLASFYG